MGASKWLSLHWIVYWCPQENYFSVISLKRICFAISCLPHENNQTKKRNQNQNQNKEQDKGENICVLIDIEMDCHKFILLLNEIENA